MRQAIRVAMLLLLAVSGGQLAAQVFEEEVGRDAAPTGPEVETRRGADDVPLRAGPETTRDIDVPPPGRQRGAPTTDLPAEAQDVADAVARPEPQFQVSQVALPDVTEDELTKAARVLARANAAYAAHRDAIMQAVLEGDDAEYAALHERIEAETEAALADNETDAETYHRVLSFLPENAALNQRFFAKLREFEGAES